MVYDNLSENDSSFACIVAVSSMVVPPVLGMCKNSKRGDRDEVYFPLLERSHREVPVQRFGYFAVVVYVDY